jgi:G3E family GTPase
VDLLVDQVEFADVIVINKTDLVTSEDVQSLIELTQRLNPEAKVLTTTEGRVDLAQVLGTGLFSMEAAETHEEWLSVPRGEEETETEEYGISTFVYRARKPFHPQRLAETIESDMEVGMFKGVLRSKGLMWIASRHDWAHDWSQAGCSIRIDPAGVWMAASPDEEWPDDPNEVQKIKESFVGEHGDRLQELVFIGNDMSEQTIRETLGTCLLTDEEFALGPDRWADFEDPLPAMELEEVVEQVAE